MMKQGVQNKEEYGLALLSNRGGWTLREMLGSDFKRFPLTNDAPFKQSDFKATERVPQAEKPQR